MAMKGRSTCRLMQREGADGASAREAAGEGRPRAAGLNGVSSAVFRVKEQSGALVSRRKQGGTAKKIFVPCISVGRILLFRRAEMMELHIA